MKRKIIQLGNKSYSITLPIQWVKNNFLKGKSEVDVTTEGDKLTINCKKEKQDKQRELNGQIMSTDELINAILIQYREGTPTVIIHFKDANLKTKAITTFLNELWGIDYMVKAQQIIIHNIPKNKFASIQLKKCLFTLIDMSSMVSLKQIHRANQRLYFFSEYILREVNYEASLPLNQVTKIEKQCSLLILLGDCIERLKRNGCSIAFKKELQSLYSVLYNDSEIPEIFISLQDKAQKENEKIKEDLHFFILYCKSLIQIKFPSAEKMCNLEEIPE